MDIEDCLAIANPRFETLTKGGCPKIITSISSKENGMTT